MDRLDELASISSEPHGLTRLNLTPQHAAANHLAASWMREAGMATRTDEVGNLIGRYESDPSGAPALVLGSHLDSVRDAGRYDGTLGVVLAIEVVEALAQRGRRLPFALEVIAFADEEGVRFQAGLLGSKAMTGTEDPNWLELEDENGTTVAEALRAFGLDPDLAERAVRDPSELIGYLEVHIEQGPVLEAEDTPVGVVTAVSGALRHRVTVCGQSGHAGTVPMRARNDALAAAAEAVLELERISLAETDAVGTVGELTVLNAAVNVVPGSVRFSVDIRATADATLRRMDEHFRASLAAIALRRGVAFRNEELYEAPACVFGGSLAQALTEAIVAEGLPVRRLPSGAGHDAMAFADFTDSAMLFVRCRGGVSHQPSESVSVGDVQRALRVVLRTVVSFAGNTAARVEADLE